MSIHTILFRYPFYWYGNDMSGGGHHEPQPSTSSGIARNETATEPPLKDDEMSFLKELCVGNNTNSNAQNVK